LRVSVEGLGLRLKDLLGPVTSVKKKKKKKVGVGVEVLRGTCLARTSPPRRLGPRGCPTPTTPIPTPG